MPEGKRAAVTFKYGGPDQVMAYCKKLIQVAGKGGGLLIDGAIGIPDEAKPENVRAIIEAIDKYGVYGQSI